jgi:hypothetical protein
MIEQHTHTSALAGIIGNECAFWHCIKSDIMAAYLRLSNSPFNYGQYFHPRRQLYNGLNALSPIHHVHGAAAQVKFIYQTHGQGLSINYT